MLCSHSRKHNRTSGARNPLVPTHGPSLRCFPCPTTTNSLDHSNTKDVQLSRNIYGTIHNYWENPPLLFNMPEPATALPPRRGIGVSTKSFRSTQPKGAATLFLWETGGGTVFLLGLCIASCKKFINSFRPL